MKLDKKWIHMTLSSIGQGILYAILFILSINISSFSGVEWDFRFDIMNSVSFSISQFIFLPLLYKQSYQEITKRLKLLLFSFLAGWGGALIVNIITVKDIYATLSIPMCCLAAAAFYHGAISGFSLRRKCLFSTIAACLGLLWAASFSIGNYYELFITINTTVWLMLFNIITMLVSGGAVAAQPTVPDVAAQRDRPK